MVNRRAFLLTAPLAAAFPQLLVAQTATAPEPFKLITDKQLDDFSEKLDDKKGNQDLYASAALPFTYVLTSEGKKAPKEFEWHEGRDHIVNVLDGECIYEVGGSPAGGHSPKPGEWLAPSSAGAQAFTMKEGDILVIPRGTPHKRTTKDSVTFTLTSMTGKV